MAKAFKKNETHIIQIQLLKQLIYETVYIK